jgi:soluble lytic murein transglycosylase
MDSRFSLVVTALVLSVVTLACSPGTGESGRAGAGEDLIGLVDALAMGDHRFLDSLEISPGLVTRLRAVDRGAPYALGRALEARGLDEAARRVYQEELDSAADQWAGLAAVRLAGLSARHRRHFTARGHASRATALLPALRDGWYVLGESIYEEGDYRELLRVVDEMPPADSLTSGETVSSAVLAAERALWRAVASWETGSDGAAAMERAAIMIPAGAIHERLYLYLFYRSGQLAALPPETRLIMEAVYRYVRGEAAEALRLIRMVEPAAIVAATVTHVLESSAGDGGTGIGDAGAAEGVLSSPGRPPDPLVSAAVWETLEEIVGGDQSGATRSWLDRLRSAAEESGSPGLPARVDLIRASSNAALAESILVETARNSGDPSITERAVERWLDLAVIEGRPLAGVVDQLVALEAREDSFVRAVDRLLPEQVRRRAWEEIRNVWSNVPEDALEVRDHLAVVLAFAADAGLVPMDPRIDEWVTDAAQRTSSIGSTGMLVRWRAGEPLIAPEQPTRSSVPGASDFDGPDEAYSAEEGSPHPVDPGAAALEIDIANALLTAGLPAGALRMGLSIGLSPENAPATLALARRFFALGHTSAALDLARRAVSRGEMAVTEDLVPLLYPLPYRPEFESAANEHALPVALLTALVREESHFRPLVASPVGAQGLGQIMPDTASDIRRRMDWPDADVGRPGDNLIMSAFYLDYLAGEITSPVLRLAAYNAGLGRGRRWEREFGDLPLVLQIEALPFVETRWYLRRITVSHGFYHFRYHGEDPAQGVSHFLEGAIW